MYRNCELGGRTVSVAQTIANSYVQPVIACFGIVGNTLMLLTIHYGHLNDSPYVYLRNIAIGDLIILLTIPGLMFARCGTCQFSLNVYYYLSIYENFIYLVVSNLFIAWLVLLTLTMTMERFVYVRWPLKTQGLCTKERAKKICFFLFLVACSSQLGRIFTKQVYISTRQDPTQIIAKTTPGYLCDRITEPSSRMYTCSLDPETNATGLEQCFKDGVMNFTMDHIIEDFSQNTSFINVNQSSGDFSLYYKKEDFNSSTESTPSELCGIAFTMDDQCSFLVTPDCSSNGTLIKELQHEYSEAVECVAAVDRVSKMWYTKALDVYMQFWDNANIVCTGILTLFNVLIIIVVHRANNKARERVLSANKQKTVTKRRKEENRLTMSLLALSGVKIISEVVYTTSDNTIGTWLYGGSLKDNQAFQIHVIISNVIIIIEYSSYFYLLAFINRKFKKEFLKKVVYGKILRSKYFHAAFNNLSLSSTRDSMGSGKGSLKMDKRSSIKTISGTSVPNRKQSRELETAIKDFGDREL